MSKTKMPNVKKQWEVIDAENVGESFHTALRKACDSKPTSAMWNAIHVVKPETYGVYCDAIMVAVHGKQFWTLGEFAHAVKTAWLAVPYFGKVELALLHCIGEMMDVIDWQGASDFMWPPTLRLYR